VENKSDDQQPSLVHAEPVLAVKDVSETVAYWHQVLGFPQKWTWGDPPNHGGVSWQGGAFVQFSLNPQLAVISEGNSVWFRVKQLEQLYALHMEKAKVVSPLQNRPWGFAEYTVQEINGYYLTFSAPASNRERQAEKSLPDFRIAERTPTTAEFRKLAASVGWGKPSDPAVEVQWKSVAYALVAEDKQTGEAIGCAFLLGDNISIYYIKDVIVHKAWQGRGIGTTLMRELTRWVEKNAPNDATVGLFTGEHLATFYRQFGFVQACGMYRQIQHKLSGSY
jgi:GNAT superfamily N-acetyltransferase